MISGMETLNLKRILAKNPKSLLFALLADSLRESSLGIGEKLDEALQVADKGLKANPDFLQGLLVRGRILLEKGDLQEAKIDFETVAIRDPFCISAQKLFLETSKKLGQAPESEIYAEILNSLGADEKNAKEPDLVPYERGKTQPVASLSVALDEVLNEKDDDEASVSALLLQTVDSIILKSAKPQPQPATQKQVPPPKPPPLAPSLSLPQVAPASLIEKAPSPTAKQPAPSPPSSASPPNLDALINEQLASKVEDIPDLTKDMSSLLASVNEPEQKPEPKPKLEPKLAAPPNLDTLINEQLASKVEDIPDLTKDMSSLLASVNEPGLKLEPKPEFKPEPKLAAPPNLDALINEQLSSKMEDIPDLTKDMSSLLASVTEPEPEPKVAPIPAAQHPAPAAPNLDALINEQLSSKMEDLPDLTKDMASLLATAPGEPEPELVPYVPPTKKTQAVNIDALVNEQLASKVENVPDLTKDMDALLKHPTLTLAELYMDQGLPNKAVAVYKELLALEPNNEDLKTKLALAEIQAET
ncbi:MAG: hypothetical protein LBQ87_02720 [Candidatus Fibromonas sp.]|nr:hypothetical protein [Candidatus Fibromonas sp.]